ncbi:hypothetical protein A2392_01055 [Candidatus Kaiserbacteria bacterium RIFOXYB1_FULL_46_14]|uniref:DNA polymerase III subunit delta n=1 Tax=Candidatus Kaiserbacteria bacterium RIFOXYB1_FULL_46_14 TaxID=1798531 RepID=A0A1F6FJM0_9BACT|nr:MAG: hypothetical protein A2392_01055 [Candidatus Kaiserbacteria bacterium RIFOXYB1_FULL_46_14]
MPARANLLIANSLQNSTLAEELRTPGADIHHLIVPQVSIDDVRRLKEESARMPVLRERLTFVIVARAIEPEAQHALLKLFEEPPEKTEFFVILPHESRLIPTLRSRFVGLSRTLTTNDPAADNFLRLSYKERLEFIATENKRDPEALRTLVTAIGQNASIDTPAVKKALLLVSRYVYNRGAGQKMLLEELALALPIK